jgi:RND family efflux transporter MFP subunit
MVVTSASTYVCSWVISSVLLAASGTVSGDAQIAAITVPSADVTLSFTQPGRIAKIHFKEGETVRAGDALVQLDDAADQIRLAVLRAESENLTQIQAAEASLDQKRVDLKKLQIAAEHNAATELEVEHAKLDVRIAELSLKVAIFEHEQAQRKYEEAKILIDNMSLKTPIDGSIEKINVETGESVNALGDVVRVVQIDPLWIEVPVPLTKTTNLRRGNTARVDFQDPDKISVGGTIVFIGAVADAASGTLRVRVELPNKSNRPAGEHVRVTFEPSQNNREEAKR